MNERLPDDELETIKTRWMPDSGADVGYSDAVRDVGRLVEEVERTRQPVVVSHQE